MSQNQFFWITYIILQSLIILEVVDAFTRRRLFRWQVEKREDGKLVGVIAAHGGIIMDAIAISLLTASIFSRFADQWSAWTWVKALVPCLTATGIMVNQWRRGSYEIDEAFNQNGRITFGGWVHAIYFGFCFTVIVLFYFATQQGITRGYGLTVTVVCAVHLAIGLIQPEYSLKGKVNKGNIIAAVVATAILFYGYEKLPFSN